jgi:hypothetical protein
MIFSVPVGVSFCLFSKRSISPLLKFIDFSFDFIFCLFNLTPNLVFLFV